MSHCRATSPPISSSKATPRTTLRLARPSWLAGLQANSKVFRSATITQFIPAGTTRLTDTSNLFRRHRHLHRLSIRMPDTTTANALTTIQDTITPVTTTKTFLLGIALVVLVLFSAESAVTVSTLTVDSKSDPTSTPIIIYITVTVVATATPTINQHRRADCSRP